ncbi:MAG: tetratricopeptide repeat protein, partial [Bacteroidetes bacterium]
KAGSHKYLVYAMLSVSAWVQGHESPASGKLDGDQRKALEKEAEQLVKAAMEMEGAVDWLWFYWGGKLNHLDRRAEAEALLEYALARFPDQGASYWELAFTKFGMGKIDEGVSLYDKGLHLSPYRAYDYLRFCGVLMGYGHTKKAFEVLERLFQLDPDYHSQLSGGSSIGTAGDMFDYLGRRELAQQFRALQSSDAIDQFRSWLSRHPQWEADPEANKQLVDLVKKLDLNAWQLWEAGKQFYAEKDLQQAEGLFKLAFELSPQDVGLLNNIGAHYIIHGDFDRAEKYWLLGLNQRPDNMLLSNLSLLYFFMGDYEKIRATLKTARTTYPNERFYYEMEALTNYFLNSADNSRWLFETVEKVVPGFMGVWDFLENMRAGEYSEAVCIWEGIDVHGIEVFLPLLQYYIAALVETGDNQAAYDALVSADRYGGYLYTILASHPVLEKFRETAAYERYMYNHFPEKFDSAAIEAYRDTLPSFPFQASFNRLMGLYHRYHKRYDAAIQYFLKSLETAPDNDAAKIYLADLYQKTGRIKEANAITPKELESDGLEAHWVAGSVYYHLNQGEKAERHFKEFVRQANDYRYPNNRVGAFYRIHGDFALAETFLQEDLRLHPDDKTFPPSDCRCETNLLKKDVRLHPTNLTARLNLALVYFFSDEKEKCYALLAESIRREPGQLSLQALLAFLHYFDDPAQAAPYFSQANALAPGFYQLWDEMEYMRANQYDQADQAWENASARFSDWWMEIVKYQYMLMKIRQGEMKRAMELLDELLDKEVFVNFQFYQTDTGLAPLRKIPRYKELMQHYFPGKNVK